MKKPQPPIHPSFGRMTETEIGEYMNAPMNYTGDKIRAQLLEQAKSRGAVRSRRANPKPVYMFNTSTDGKLGK